MRHSDPKIAPTLASAAEAVEPAPEPTDHVPGEIIAGKYRLTRVLGVGGMGAVWQARNETLDVDVAVKLIRRDTATEVSPERLLREARAAARVDHPSVVRIFDFGETERGEPFIVMELLGGEPLRHLLLRKERLPALGAVQTLLPVASALGAAHVKGVIHRDLKPENVLLTRDERGAVIPKVVDFGIAKLRHGGAEPQVTQEGAALGSPAYMSPEQARGQDDIDGRADVWSLSVVLYEAITGKLPFDGRSYNALLASILEDAPRPASELAEVDDALWRIIERGLCKDRPRRWQSMEELGEALATWAVGRGADADVTGRSIALTWLDRVARRPYTDPPPPLGQEATTMPVLPAVPALAAAARSASTSAPPPEPVAIPAPAPAPVIAAEPAPEPAPVPATATVSAPPADSPPADIAEPPGQEPAARGGILWLALPLLAVAVALALRPRNETAPARPGPSAAVTPGGTPQAARPTAAPTMVPANAVTAVPAVTAAATAKPASEPPTAGDVTACAARHFASDAFPAGAVPDLGWICAEVDPRKGAAGLKQRVVQGGGDGVTNAMKEQALLHWYEMATFAVLQARCCPGAAPLSLPPPIGTCAPLDRTMEAIGAAAAGGGDAATAGGDVDAAIARHRAAVQCAVTSGAHADYPWHEQPPGGAEPTLRRIIDRGAAR